MRILTLSIGNTSVYAGLFRDSSAPLTFRLTPADLFQLPQRIRGGVDWVAVCSVVPAFTPDVLRLILRTWGIEAMLLDSEADLPFRIDYRQPAELGTDRIAAAWGARSLYPRKDVIVVDCGTATTVTALRRDGVLLGGAILPGLALWAGMLSERTAQLPYVAPRRPRSPLGRSTREGIASGLFHGHAGAIRELVTSIRTVAFGRRPVTVVGTGGNAERLSDENLFSKIEPALVLLGLREFARTCHRPA
jgi:type III pantothenate kinase